MQPRWTIRLLVYLGDVAAVVIGLVLARFFWLQWLVGSPLQVDLAVWDHTMNLDLKGPFLCCRFGIPHLIAAGGGSIVNVSSVVALKGSFPGHVYTAAKGGIISFT